MVSPENERRKKKLSPGKIIALILVLMMAEPEFLGILLGIAALVAPIGIVLFLIFRQKKHKESHQRALENTTFGSCRQQKAFDERIQELFCRHKDKAIHHVARGREIDPWDRPDIDISKYQRKE